MATAVIMPRQGQSVESCVIGEWFKKSEMMWARASCFFLRD